MSDNTQRAVTSGGDIIASLDVDGVKTQVMRVATPAGRASRRIQVPERSAQGSLVERYAAGYARQLEQQAKRIELLKTAKPLFAAHGAVWTPASIISQVAMWLDASDSDYRIATTTISQLTDKSGNGRHATQATGALQPALASAAINGLDVARFTTGAGETMTLGDLSSLTEGEGFIVMKLATDPINSDTWKLGTNGSGTSVPYVDGIIYDDFGSLYRSNDMGAPSAATAPGGSVATQCIYNAVATATEWSSWLNGVQLTTIAIGVTIGFPAAGSIGKTTGQSGTDGDIGEVIVFNQKLSATDKALVFSYLQTKWGTP